MTNTDLPSRLKKFLAVSKNSLAARSKFPILGWVAFAGLIALLSVILSFHVDYLPSNIRVGRVVSKDIKADRNYEIIDAQATETNRQEAFQRVRPVYDYDPHVGEEIDQKIKAAFESARRRVNASAQTVEVETAFEEALGVEISAEAFQALLQNKFSPKSEWALRKILRQAMGQRVVAKRGVLPSEGGGLVLRDIQKRSPNNEIDFEDLTQITSTEELGFGIKEEVKALDADSDLVKPAFLGELATLLVLPNTTFNSVETELRRAKVVSKVPNVIIKVQAGEAIIRGGDRYEPYHLTILEGIRKQKSETRYPIKVGGTALFIAMLLSVTFYFSRYFLKEFKPGTKDLYFLGGMLIVLLLGVRFAAAISSGLKDLFPYEISVQAIYYAIPVAGGAMLARFMLGAEVALVFGIVLSALTGMFLEADLDLSIYYLISGIAAAGAIAHVVRRSSILKAGVVTGAVNAGVVLAIKLVTVVSITEVFSFTNILVDCGMAFLGGIFSSIFVMVAAPIAEWLFDYVSDIKLLELGNLNHPLLKQMIVSAPGTYHHSQLVAVLAEAAAAEIGANPLLARVGSYFHDIGKMSKPSYFIENQQGGENRHDKLNPSMSALIIASHVKDGLELAREYKLPSRIIDFIPQHQGTKLISYFYNKALEMHDPEKDAPVDEKNYRYPGPKPQTREAGIILLADGVEACVRALPEKTPHKIRLKVQYIINKNFTEEQLDECEMTLHDLHMIAQTFTRVLIGIYHQRIEYPNVEEKRSNVTPLKPKQNTGSNG